MNIYVYFGGVFGTLLGTTIVLVLIARATQWKPKPIKRIWGMLVVCAAVIVAGSVCSIAARDIHVLYWWLLGLPVAAVLFPLTLVSTTLCVRLIYATLFAILGLFRGRR
jgi:hypothetical protein